METGFCIEALEDALAKYGQPEIFNTDQGSQFTSEAFTGVLKSHDVKISMDGRGRFVDTIFVERLWRSLKYENVYLNAYATGSEARHGIGEWFRNTMPYGFTSHWVTERLTKLMQESTSIGKWHDQHMATKTPYRSMRKVF